MPETEKANRKEISKTRASRLWIGILLPATAWITAVQVVYLTSEYGCGSGSFLWNHVSSVVALAASMAGLAIAWYEWRESGGGTEDRPGDQLTRRRFMAMLGIASGALFTTVIFAQWLPTLMGVPCGK